MTRIFIGYVLSDARFDWLVGNISTCPENLFRSRNKETVFSFICRIIFQKYFTKATEDFFRVYIDCVSGLPSCLEFSQLPSCLDEAM